MKVLRITSYAKNPFWVVIIISLLVSAISPGGLWAQKSSPSLAVNDSQTLLPGENRGDGGSGSSGENKNFVLNRDFRVEKIPVDGGAEIITIFVKLTGLTNSPQEKAEEVPLVSVLRDTLGDETVENDRLRYVWMLTYTKSSFAQRFAAAIPFLYLRTTNKDEAGSAPPPPIIDLHPSKKDLWNRVFWAVFRNLILEDFGVPAKAATLQYKENLVNYRKSAVARALAVLSLYEAFEGEKILTDTEMKDLQGRMLLSNKFLGSSVSSENLERVYQKNIEKVRDLRGHNWELLRQYSEAQGLYFEPLEMPDGSATHALVWVAVPDLEAANRDRKFDARFLNIKNPWNDSGLLNWKGYSETRWFDENGRPVDPDSANAKPKRLIPLALYGLDYPKIPVLLVDFRDNNNAKKREMSRRVLDDLTKNVLSVSRFSNLPYFVGHYLYGFVTARRGMDLNQSSRFGSYSQLKLLLSLNASLDPKFRDEIAGRLESASLNPLENDLDVEVKLARRQYENLMAYAKRPEGGLAARLEQDRRSEMAQLKHGEGERVLHMLGNIFSLGLYKHREEYTPELLAQMDTRRRLDFHERYLREVARVSSRPEVDGNVEAIRRSLAFVSQNGTDAQSKTAQAVAKIFSITEDAEIRSLCLSGLYRINNSTAKKELLAIYENQSLDARWRDLSAGYLRLAVKEGQRIAPRNAKTIVKIDGE